MGSPSPPSSSSRSAGIDRTARIDRADLAAHPRHPARADRIERPRAEQADRIDRHASPSTRPTRATVDAVPARVGYLRRHWRGELPLLTALVGCVLVWLTVQGIELAMRQLPMTEAPLLGAALWLLEVAVLVTGAVWWGVGVLRSAVAHGADGGSGLVTVAALLTGAGAFAWIALFWWTSARHVAPDVWATLTGRLKPATISVEGGGSRVLLSGPLEFGSMRALRAVLDAQPAVRMVRLESLGGRVDEGLALGTLIAGRNIDTLVTTECSSACVTAFAGGRQRLIAPTARLGLHSAGGPGASAAAVDEANRRSDRFIAARGVDLRVLDKGSTVAHDDIWFPEPVVLLASNLATDYAPMALRR